MIELRNVTKTYALNKKTECTAINDVSLVLPDKGLVFIIGKSGSGKVRCLI
jgi:ABC-type lipoprotein export system ATPase subunit